MTAHRMLNRAVKIGALKKFKVGVDTFAQIRQIKLHRRETCA